MNKAISLIFTQGKPARSGWYLVLYRHRTRTKTVLSELHYSAKWDAFNAFDEAISAEHALINADIIAYAPLEDAEKELTYTYRKVGQNDR